ncbi:MAG: hypothetical protein AAF679_14350 [Pseudomonadota bacterium]
MAQKILPDTPDEVIAVIEPAGVRRVFATFVVGFLGTLLIYIAATHPPQELMWLAFLVLMGLGATWLAWLLWDATSRTLELTREAVREADGGRVLFTIDEIQTVDRGFFAFKPASGFLVRLKDGHAHGRAFAPGLWWRVGRTVMVGGTTPSGQAKAMADLIKVILAQRGDG